MQEKKERKEIKTKYSCVREASLVHTESKTNRYGHPLRTWFLLPVTKSAHVNSKSVLHWKESGVPTTNWAVPEKRQQTFHVVFFFLLAGNGNCTAPMGTKEAEPARRNDEIKTQNLFQSGHVRTQQNFREIDSQVLDILFLQRLI